MADKDDMAIEPATDNALKGHASVSLLGMDCFNAAAEEAITRLAPYGTFSCDNASDI